MVRKKKKVTKFVSKLLASLMVIMSLSGDTVGMVQAAESENTGGRAKNESGDWVSIIDDYESTQSYYTYIKQHEEADKPEIEVEVDLMAFEIIEPAFEYKGEKTQKYQNREGSKEGVFLAANSEEVIFEVEVPENGLYSIAMKYYPLAESNARIMFGVKIDGELPFIESGSCMLSRVYENQEIRQDENGDDLRPKSEQKSEWRIQYLYDKTGVNGILSFYLEKGTHEISLCFDGTPILLEKMILGQEPYMLSYQDYVSLGRQSGYKDTQNVSDIYQAENYYQQSSSTLWPDYDRSSPLTQPFEYDHVRINYGGGAQWNEPGQWIRWTVNAPKDGYYNIGVKYRQGYLDGLFSSRKIYIDGEVPFSELSSVRFDYTTQWENKILGTEYEPYSIYLTEGEHVITMENVVGELDSTMSVLRNVIADLNDLYLSVIMITGSDPDPYRDYYLERLLPNLSTNLKANATLMFEEAERLVDIVGSRGSETAFFENVAYNLESYADNIVDLTYKSRITNLKNDISSLSAKLSSYQVQALDVDYIMLLSPKEEMPAAAPNLIQSLKYQIGIFVNSFQKEEKENKDAVRVWISTGNDQLKIIQDMITDLFTPQYGIEIDLELVQGTLIEATVAGNGPDVAIGIAADTVVNLAMRGALEELSQFDGYWEVLDEYIEGCEIPFRLEGRYYGVPNTGAFSVMFVRTDIFERMGLEVPDTWEEMYDVAQVLQRNNMSLGTVPTFANLLYQKGGTYFDEGLTKVLFDEEIAVEALKQHAEFYTKYGFELSYDFVSRFRTGDMPIGVASYSTYNNLKYSAPEISGLWEMYCMPGTTQEDGTVNYTQMDNNGTGTIMFSGKENSKEAWEFIKWWSSAEAQTRYATDLEAVMGVSARYTAQNLETLRAIDWGVSELAILEEQISHLQYIPIVPGNYYVTRGLSNANRAVVYDGENPREMLKEWTIKINDEIARKREEFFLNN